MPQANREDIVRNISHQRIEAAIRRGHQLRNEAIRDGFFRLTARVRAVLRDLWAGTKFWIRVKRADRDSVDIGSAEPSRVGDNPEWGIQVGPKQPARRCHEGS